MLSGTYYYIFHFVIFFNHNHLIKNTFSDIQLDIGYIPLVWLPLVLLRPMNLLEGSRLKKLYNFLVL